MRLFESTPELPRHAAVAALLLTCLVALLSTGPGCVDPQGPANPAIPDEICQPRCQRQHDCDPSSDMAACMTRCRGALSPRVVYESAEFAGKLAACSNQQACGAGLDGRILSCWADVRARSAPSDAARKYCGTFVDKEDSCATRRVLTYDRCLYGTKVYSDETLAQLTACLERSPCDTASWYSCEVDVVGLDERTDDSDRVEAFRVRPVPTVRANVNVAGTVVIGSTKAPLGNARVCVNGRPEIACAVSDVSTGAFALILPARSELAITATAPGYGGRLVAVVTTTNDWDQFTIAVPKLDVLRTRYGGFGATPPDAATGALFATARAPRGSKGGLDGVTLAAVPSSGTGPFYFAPKGVPDPALKATSTWSSSVFANLTPGVVEVTFGPENVTCTPYAGGWPSPKPNTVRVPILAGLESRVVLQCHR
jgi:hypothetical protein